jgi:hypothetical protein
MRRTSVITSGFLAVVILLAALQTTAASEKKNAQEGPLADRPSKPGAHLAKVAALGENAWLNLGKPKPDPKYGAAKGRAYSRKMAFAPDLRGAFIYGEGQHGQATVRAGQLHYNDDLYFYDVNAHAWVCCHPGTLAEGEGNGLRLDEASGSEVDRNGNILPVAISTHAYWSPSYDVDRKVFMIMPSPASDFWRGRLDKFRPYIKNIKQNPNRGTGKSPFFWDPRTGKWERRKAKGDGAGGGVDNALFYSLKLKKAVYMTKKGRTYLYDYPTNTWKKVSNQGPGKSSAYCYDSKRDRVYAVFGKMKRDEKGNLAAKLEPNTLSVYDIGANKWTKPQTAGEPGWGAYSHTAFFTYDTVSDVAVLYVRNAHHIYDPVENKWTVMPTTFPEKQKGPGDKTGVRWGASSGFYDPETNAHFYFNAGDSKYRPGNMWVYRYKKAGKKTK